MKYQMLITPMREGGYLVTFPGIKGCITDGETLEAAIANAKDVLECWVEADCPLPEPEYYEDIGETVFLTRDEAEAALKGKDINVPTKEDK